MVLTFFYDQYGRPYAMNYNNLGFLWYMLNHQGDVVALIGYDGAIYATYEYDAWGNIIHQSSDNYATVNPLRYRGYVYDEETELYYCNSRYYDPQTGRFINADSFVATAQGLIGNNMFAYCNNNPVCFTDPSGHMLAYDMFAESIEGNGSDKEYDEKSKLSKALAESTSLKAVFEQNLAKFIASGAEQFGIYYGSFSTYGGDTLTDKDLALSVGAADYRMTIERETRTIGFWFFRKVQTRYVATIVVSDTYDFTEWRTDLSFGSVANNFAYIGQMGGIVKPYYWQATVIMTTEWE